MQLAGQDPHKLGHCVSSPGHLVDTNHGFAAGRHILLDTQQMICHNTTWRCIPISPCLEYRWSTPDWFVQRRINYSEISVVVATY